MERSRNYPQNLKMIESLESLHWNMRDKDYFWPILLYQTDFFYNYYSFFVTMLLYQNVFFYNYIFLAALI